MSTHQSKVEKFWQEIKRRNVVRRNTVYAASAFVILELVSIIQEPLGLPEWTLKAVIILLSAGFILSVIFSWLFNVNNEGELVRVRPEPAAGQEDTSVRTSGWKTASYISFMVIIILIILNIIPRAGSNSNLKVLEKSIAVLPFSNESSDQENSYFINGTMESILDNLARIEDLRVPGRTSVEQYRDASISVPEIASEMKVSYLLSGTGQKLGDRILLTVHLLDGVHDRQLWSKQYDRRIREVQDLLDIQSEIAHLVASEIEAIITPAEKERINRPLTTNLIAYHIYQKAQDEHNLYRIDNSNRKALLQAEELYRESIRNDSTFANGYIGLATTYWHKRYWDTYFSDEFLDSVLIYVNQALYYDDQLSRAYAIKGYYYRAQGETDRAIVEFDKALEINPNDSWAYEGKGWVFQNYDLLRTIKNFHLAVERNRGPRLPGLIGILAEQYNIAGFPDQARKYYKQKLLIDHDSSSYYFGLFLIHRNQNNKMEALNSITRAYAYDSLNQRILSRIYGVYLEAGLHEESLRYLERYIHRNKELGGLILNGMHRIGYAFSLAGDSLKAEERFETQLEYCNAMIEKESRDPNRFFVHYDRAAVYAYRGQEELAMKDLRIFIRREKMPLWMVVMIKEDPLLDNLRDRPEFKQIVDAVGSKYLAEHERVQRWLEENEMI
ncbi:MAG: hypothetical protein R6U78_10545 [Bacteroidales bacterium]